ncbi:NUDIX domain-containing protein [uncultured Roseobacter sp.]|uniref:NUDIX domain-containing protein n=1 Tax=uncultured Roseobacter sp. TaxID=114847 RepID=UPI0026166540|nr:NUDIX domain-containing protein [uncultured Roseobacter sp.]
MGQLFFFFGTLRDPALLDAVIGNSSHVTLTPAQLPGYEVCSVAEGPFPTILANEEAFAEGLLVAGLRAEDVSRLDYYESAFGYSLHSKALDDGRQAQVYFPQPDLWTPDGPWSLTDWSRDHGRLSILAALEVMTYQGTKSPGEVGLMFPMIRARAWASMNAEKSIHGARTLDGQVTVARTRRPYANYFALDEYDLTHERFDGGTTPEVMRAVFRAPDATLVLPYDPVRDRVLLVEQMRMGPLARGDRVLWQLEPVAGRLDPGEAPQDAARREAFEEASLQIGDMFSVAEAYCSPGNSSEFYYIYVGFADLPDTASGTGGLISEQEDIRSHILSFEELMAMCDRMELANAPLITSAYWLARHRSRLRAMA